MLRPTLFITALLCLTVQTATAGQSFKPAVLAPEAGIEALNRSVAVENFDRELLGSTYQSVVIGRVDVYDQFPYLESHYFQVVSDPKWNRLVFGESDRGLAAYDGKGSAFGALNEPRGLATDAEGRIYVADAGNDRVLVLQTSSEFDELRLTPLFAVEGLARPFDVAVSDAGTPLDASDDVLYVANTGANEVRRYALDGDTARLTASMGELGSGDQRFAGPMSIAVGRTDGKNNDEIFVADAHNQRMVRLVAQGDALLWGGALPHDLGVVTGMDTDHWGNVYAAAPNAGVVQKFTRDLLPVAELDGDVRRPRSFHIPMVTVTDHVRGTTVRSGQGSGVLLEEWGSTSGIRLMDLGVELNDVAMDPSGELQASFVVTDRAAVTARILDPKDGAVLAEHNAGSMDAGARSVSFSDEDLLGDLPAGDYQLQISARSTYENRDDDAQTVSFQLSQDRAATVPQRAMLGAAEPNPFNPSTTIRFSIPGNGQQRYTLRVYDARGRQVRVLGSGLIDSGDHTVMWNGTDDRGQSVGSGIYLYRLEHDGNVLTNKMVLVK